MTVTELCFFSEGFREPVVGANRYGGKLAISLPSRLCEGCYLRSGVRSASLSAMDLVESERDSFPRGSCKQGGTANRLFVLEAF